MQNDDAIQHRQHETYTVQSLFTLAYLVLTPAQKLELEKNFTNTINVDIRICCTLLSELIKSNDQPQFFHPLTNRRCMFAKNRQSRLTCFNVTHTAVEFGHINCLKMAHELGFPLYMTDNELNVNMLNRSGIKYSDIKWKRGIPSKAAYYGSLTCLKYAHQQRISWDVSTCTAATLGENYDCLKYAVENGCPINESGPINQAAENGNLLFLKYLHEHGCPWSAETSEYAISGGNLKCLEYIHANGCPWSELTCYQAVAVQNFECLKFVVENGCPLTEDAINQAAVGNLLFLKYLHELGCPWSVKTCAAATADLDCLKYLRANGCPWDASTCTMAIKNNKVDSLKFAVENGCPLDVPEPANEAATQGNLSILKYLHEHGCPWSVETFARAASKGDFGCLKYMQANRCPWDVSTCINAVKNKHFSFLKFVIDKGCPLDSPQPALEAASIGNLAILKYMHERGCPWIAGTCTLAAYIGDIKYLKHARAKGCPWDTRTLGEPLIYMYEKCLKLMERNKCEWDNSICIEAMGKSRLAECIDYAWRNSCPLRIGTCSAGSGDGRMDCLLSEPDHNCKWDHKKFHGYAAVLRKTREITSAHITALLIYSIMEISVIE